MMEYVPDNYNLFEDYVQEQERRHRYIRDLQM